MSIASGDLATWIGSIGTAGALAAALVQIGTERRARHRAESENLKTMRRLQAEKVSTWWGGPAVSGGDWLILLNRSNEPVYRAVAILVLIQGAGPHQGEDYQKDESGSPSALDAFVPIAIIPPGRWRVQVSGGWGGMMRRPGAELAFTDCSGNHWIRRASGNLQEVSTDAITHYELPAPIPFLSVPESFPPMEESGG
jgi:hypothetical protein